MSNTYNCGGQGGCAGATAELGFGYTQTFGLTSEYKYSYSSYQGVATECAFNHTKQTVEVTVDGYAKLPENSYPHLL
jgi:cathepsin L